MKDRIKELNCAWSVYREWLISDARHVEHLTFSDWLHFQYESARKACAEEDK